VSFLSLRPTPLLTHIRPNDRYDPTIEDSYSVTRTIDGLPYFLSLTDTAGQEEYRGLWAASNLQSDAFLLVYDITNASSLDALDYFMDMIDIEEESRMEENNNAELRGVRGGKEMRAPPVKIVAGNKCDLKDSRVVSSRTGLEWARQRRCGFMETSAREMVNIEETFACTSHLHCRRRGQSSLAAGRTVMLIPFSNCPPGRRSPQTRAGRPRSFVTATPIALKATSTVQLPATRLPQQCRLSNTAANAIGGGEERRRAAR
jgi:hypothetical protein